MFKHLALTGALLFMSNKVQSFTKYKGVRMAATKSKKFSITLLVGHNKKQKLKKNTKTISKEVNKKKTTKIGRKTKRKRKNTKKSITMRKRM